MPIEEFLMQQHKGIATADDRCGRTRLLHAATSCTQRARLRLRTSPAPLATMGNSCCGLRKREQGYEIWGRNAGGQPDDTKMLATWRSTGIIGLRDRRLKELPSTVTAVGPDAKVLDATLNRLGDWPPQLSSLVNLQKLTLASNSITFVDGSTLLLMSASLRLLVLDDNALSSLPDELGSLSRLERLSVKMNDLTDLNPCIGRLKNLQFLCVAKNNLRQIPPQLTGCESLEELDAGDNRISDIPPDLGALTKLKSLLLDNNRISQVPPAVFLDCVALQTLSLHGNPVVPDAIQETEGFQAFEQRRRQKYNKGLAGGVLLGPRGLDEGIDRRTTQ